METLAQISKVHGLRAALRTGISLGGMVPWQRGRQAAYIGVVLSRPHIHSRRFDVARLIGDHLVFETDDAWKPATQALTARQKFQRAFAAEFLCPSEELAKRYNSPIELDDLDDVTCSVAEEYNVSQTLVLNHFANRNLIPQSLATESGSTDHAAY